MKILTVAVFCAYFVAAFFKESNGTISSRFTGKSLRQRLIIRDPKITRRLSTVLITNVKGETLTLGVLLNRDTVAFPESYWKANTGMRVYVNCFNEGREPLSNSDVALKNCIPEKERMYLATGIVEVKLAEEVPAECWPLEEERYTKCATAKELDRGNPVFAIAMDAECETLYEKPFLLGDLKMNKYVKVTRSRGISSTVSSFTYGEPLFHEKKIAGMYVSGISNKRGMFTENIRYIIFRKQSVGQSSN